MTIRALGDSALLVDVVSPNALNAAARVAQAAEILREADWPEVVEIVPALTAVCVQLRRGAAWGDMARRVGDAIEAGMRAEPPPVPSRLVTIPVSYGEDHGPDLGDVASHTGLAEQAVIDRHAAGDYLVQAIGFAPGFPYLTGMDAALACPRRATPQERVPAGSVGIGGTQTGVYPQASPGGWNIIGRCPDLLFDPEAKEPSRLRAGDRVRFQSISAAEFEERQREATRQKEIPGGSAGAAAIGGIHGGITGATAIEGIHRGITGAAAIEVIHGGMQTTVQDAGRVGFQSVGVTEGGATDSRARRLANLMVGNAADAAILEWPLQGPKLLFRERRLVAITGARSEGVPFGRPFVVDAGDVLDLSRVPAGCRGNLAIGGGIDVPRVLGSRSTHLAGEFGGWRGRALRTGDVLPLGETTVVEARGDWLVSPSLSRTMGLSRSMTDDIAEIRVLRGPEADWFATAAWRRLLEEPFAASTQSDRMGLRLTGAELLRKTDEEMVSQPVVAGTVQVPPDGQPIVLLCDRQSLGGYPRLANVISVDLPVLAQVRPRGRVRFTETTLEKAEALRLAEERDFARLEAGLRERFRHST